VRLRCYGKLIQVRIFIKFLILFLFLGELVLDSSTPFVRCGFNPGGVNFVKTSAEKSGSENSGKKDKSAATLNLEYSAHAALPVVGLEPFKFFTQVTEEFQQPLFSYKSPLISRIERPPIC
jgi:hypothetical protein